MTIYNEIGPFAVVPLWVMERLTAIGKPEALRLYVGLAKWTAGDDRTCHPSRKTIAEYLDVSDRTVDTYVKALVGIGALVVRHRHTELGDHTSNDYTLIVSPRGAAHFGTPPEADVGPGPEADFAQTRPNVEPDPTEPLSAPSQAMDAADRDAAFEQFWITYERTGPKKKARECWLRAIRKDTPENIQAGLEAWMHYWHQPGAAQIKWPQGWLNEERWRDEPPVVRQQANTAAQRSRAVLDNARRQINGGAMSAMYGQNAIEAEASDER